MPIMAFRKCAGCENYFVNLTKKEKKYCTNNCAARKRQREKRADLKKRIAAGDPEAKKEYEIEKQKSRARASRSYDKRTNPNGNRKIHKRPRKKHREAVKSSKS
jgi:hypothetical protein